VPGEDGGPVRRTARDLAASFARELPPGSDAMPAWRTLTLGDVGRATVELHTDDDGRLTGETIFKEKNPPDALVEVVRRTRARLGRSVVAPLGKTAGPGMVSLLLSARIEMLEVREDLQGGPFDLAFSFHDEHGECAFSLPEGRRVTVSIDVVSRAPRAK